MRPRARPHAARKAEQRPSSSAMSSAAAAQAPPAPPAQPDWLTLPLELLQRCLGHLADKRAALSSCRRLARVVLLNSLQQERPARLHWDVDRAEPLPSARLVQALVGEQANKGLTLVLYSDDDDEYTSPAHCLAELRASRAVLTCITRLEMLVRSTRSCPVTHCQRCTPDISPLACGHRALRLVLSSPTAPRPSCPTCGSCASATAASQQRRRTP